VEKGILNRELPFGLVDLRSELDTCDSEEYLKLDP